jgi:hypothetical protein
LDDSRVVRPWNPDPLLIPTEVPQEYLEQTYAEKDAETAANLNEDDELPPYSIYARIFHPDKPVVYQRLACGHKLRGEFEPNHRNCERCWFTYFQIHGELTQAVEQGYQAGGPSLIKNLKGDTFLHNFRKYMSTVAFVQAQQKAVADAAKEPSSV